MTLWDYFKNLGIAEDEILDAVTGGPATESFSLRWAHAAANGSRVGCFVCAALSVLVQKNHCAKQLAGQPMSVWNYLRAFACITAVFTIPLYFLF